jgi:hypothetical protein
MSLVLLLVAAPVTAIFVEFVMTVVVMRSYRFLRRY